MKKLAIGCSVIVLVLGVAAAGVGYYLYRQVQSTITQFAELGQVPEIERGVRQRGGFVPPSSEELTKSQVERLLRVQTRVREHLGQRALEFEAKYRSFSQKETASLSDLPTVMAGYRDVVALWVDAKRSQVEALNEVEFSLDEYRWVRDQAYRALGVPFMDLDIGKIVEDVRNGRTSTEPGQLRGAFGESGPEANRKLVDAIRKQLEDNLPLASFGL